MFSAAYGLDPRRVGLDMAHRPSMVSALLVKNAGALRVFHRFGLVLPEANPAKLTSKVVASLSISQTSHTLRSVTERKVMARATVIVSEDASRGFPPSGMSESGAGAIRRKGSKAGFQGGDLEPKTASNYQTGF